MAGIPAPTATIPTVTLVCARNMPTARLASRMPDCTARHRPDPAGISASRRASVMSWAVMLWRPWLLFRSAARRPAAHTTWMPPSRRSYAAHTA
jgi:hypothetical protein